MQDDFHVSNLPWGRARLCTVRFCELAPLQVAFGSTFAVRLRVAHGGPGTGSGMRLRAVRMPEDGTEACAQKARARKRSTNLSRMHCLKFVCIRSVDTNKPCSGIP